MGPNPVNRLELPKFREPKRKRPTVAAEDVPRVLAALSPKWRPLFATAFFLGVRRGEVLALQREDIDLRDWTITVRRSHAADVTKGGDDGTVPIPEPLRPYLDAALRLSPSRWVFPAADGSQRAPDTNLKAVLQRALGRAGIVDGYEHRCRKPAAATSSLPTTTATAAAQEGHRFPLAPAHDGDTARAREGSSFCGTEDPAAREHRDHARDLHAPRRHRRHARGRRETRLRAARGASASSRRSAQETGDLCCQVAASSRFPKS